MFSKKQTIILIVLIFVLIGGIFLYRQKYDNWPWQKGVIAPLPTTTASPENGSISPAAKTDRDHTMEDVAKKIATLSPEQPVLGGKWFTDRFWFVDGSNNTFYVEYEDGHILRQLLLAADLSQMPNKISYSVRAYFTPGESGWILQSGKDEAAGKNLILYEYDETSGRWTQRN